MSDPLTNDLRGEGFAYFRWHSLQWSDTVNTCTQHRYEDGLLTFFCARLWEENKSALQRSPE